MALGWNAIVSTFRRRTHLSASRQGHFAYARRPRTTTACPVGLMRSRDSLGASLREQAIGIVLSGTGGDRAETLGMFLETLGHEVQIAHLGDSSAGTCKALEAGSVRA